MEDVAPLLLLLLLLEDDLIYQIIINFGLFNK